MRYFFLAAIMAAILIWAIMMLVWVDTASGTDYNYGPYSIVEKWNEAMGESVYCSTYTKAVISQWPDGKYYFFSITCLPHKAELERYHVALSTLDYNTASAAKAGWRSFAAYHGISAWEYRDVWLQKPK